MTIPRFPFHLAALFFAGASLAACATSVSVWPVDSLDKIFPQDQTPSALEAGPSCWIPRNGHASLQYAVRSASAIKKLNVRVTAGGGLAVQVRHVGYVPVGSNPANTPPDELLRPAPAFFPDPLFEDFPYQLLPNRTDAIWITLYAPASAKPGVYEGQAVFESDGTQIAAQSFKVKIVEATVPEKPTLRVTNWFELTPEHLGHYYKLSGGDDERYWELLSNIGKVMAAHKQTMMLTPFLSLVKPRVEGSGMAYDFSRLDRWIETFKKAGLPTIEGGHLLGRVSGYQTALRVPAFVVEDGKPVQKMLEPEDPRAEAFFNTFLPALYAHFKERGWAGDYIQHIHDEPHGPEGPVYNRFARIIRKNLPGVPTLDAVDLNQDLSFFADMVDIWVPVLGSFDKLLDTMKAHVDKGGQMWFYTCIGPQDRYLNRFDDLPLLKTRLLHWFNFRYNLTGFLHWGGNYWSPEPFDNVQPIINDGETLLPAGDNAITYPLADKYTILSSIRLEAMREGIEDYEVLVALSKRDPKKAAQLAQEAIPHFTDYIRNTAVFRRLQARLLE